MTASRFSSQAGTRVRSRILVHSSQCDTNAPIGLYLHTPCRFCTRETRSGRARAGVHNIRFWARRCAVWLSWVRADLEVAATYRARRAVPDSCRLLTPASGERGDVGRPAMDRGEIITGMNRAYCSWPRVRLAVISASASRPARASGSAPAGGSIRAYFRWFRAAGPALPSGGLIGGLDAGATIELSSLRRWGI